MKKQIVILLIALFLLIFCGIWEINYLENTSRYLKSDVDSIRNFVENENYDMADKAYDNMENTWNSMVKVWNIFVNHERIDYLEESMIVLKANIETKQKDEAIDSIEKINRVIAQIVEKQRPTFEHVL